jgi:putative SOS response-associated peptidase YedK
VEESLTEKRLGDKALSNPHIYGMCGRYASYLPADLISRLFSTVNPPPNVRPTWNMAPSQGAMVVRRADDGARHLDVLKWGLVPYSSKDLKKARKPINARSETVASSAMFRAAFAERRCLVPAAAYYEWRDDADAKVPFAIARQDGDPVAFAGIWDSWTSPEGERIQTFATMTTEANAMVRDIQERMPVIIEPEDWAMWLGEVEGDPQALLRPAPENVLRLWPVDRRVNKVANDGPDLLEPRDLPDEESSLF